MVRAKVRRPLPQQRYCYSHAASAKASGYGSVPAAELSASRQRAVVSRAQPGAPPRR